MKKKKDTIIHAPVLSLSAKVELVARFLRNAIHFKHTTTQDKTSDVAKGCVVNEELPKKKKTIA